MIHLRHRLFWLLSGWSFVVTVVIASVYPMVLLSALPFAWGDKLVHALAYFLMMIWFAGLYARRHQAIVALFVLALGFLMEMVQWWLPYRPTRSVLLRVSGCLCGSWPVGVRAWRAVCGTMRRLCWTLNFYAVISKL